MPPTAGFHQQQFSLRILAANQLSPMAAGHRNIPAWRQKLSAAEVSCDLNALHQRQEAHEGSNLLAKWRTASQHFIITLRTASLQEGGAGQATSFPPSRARDVTVVGWALEEGKNHTKSPAEGGAGR